MPPTELDRLDYSRANVEKRTRLWIETNYLRAVKDLAGRTDHVWNEAGEPRRLTRYHFQEIQRKLKIFRWLDRLQFESLIDVGSGFDVYPNLVRERYGAAAYFSDFGHTMNLPYGGAGSGRLDRAITLNSARLPFADDTFDVVLASEVLEHLVRPVETIAEFVRVSRKYVVMTSLEALSTDAWQRFLSHLRVDVRREHVERNFFLMDELDALFGPQWHHENLLYDPQSPARAFDPEEQQIEAYAAFRDVDSLTAALCRAAAVEGHPPGSMGIVLVKVHDGAEVGARRPEADADLCRWLIEKTCSYERFVRSLASNMATGTAEICEPDRPLADELLALLRCPDCRSALERAPGGLSCRGCGRAFAAQYGVPILYPSSIPEGREALLETLQQICGDDAARRRVVRRLARRLRRNERPPGLVRRALWQLIGAPDTQ